MTVAVGYFHREKWGLPSLSLGAHPFAKAVQHFVAAWTERAVPIFRRVVARASACSRGFSLGLSSLGKWSRLSIACTFLLMAAPPAAAQYANPKLCAACHPAIAKTWRQNGMGRSFSAPRPEILVEDFTKNNGYYHPASDTTYQMLNRDGVLIQRRYQRGFEGKETNVDEKRVDYIVGSGNHMRTYVHRNADGTLLE